MARRTVWRIRRRKRLYADKIDSVVQTDGKPADYKVSGQKPVADVTPAGDCKRGA